MVSVVAFGQKPHNFSNQFEQANDLKERLGSSFSVSDLARNMKTGLEWREDGSDIAFCRFGGV